jgi:flagellar basal body-associated protein FliL
MLTVILIVAAVLLLAGLIVLVMMSGKAKPAARTQMPAAAGDPRGSVRSTTGDD